MLVPTLLMRAIFILIGISLGAVVTPETLHGMATYPLSIGVAEVMIAFAPGSVDAMMLLALALSLDPVYVGAHHLTRIFFVSLTMPLVARRTARSLKIKSEPAKPLLKRPPFQD